jgi:hypothetical protein
MPQRFFLPVIIGNKHMRIFIDDIRQIHKTKRINKPQVPKYSD